MKIILLFILFLNVSWANEKCTTASELMSSTFSGGEFTKICKNIVESDPGCKQIKPEKRMSCDVKSENEILSSKNLLGKVGACLKGFLWDSMVELGKFVIDLIKLLVGASIDSVSSMIKFMTDSDYREKALSDSKLMASKTGKMARAFLNSSAMYFSREFSKNLAKNPLNPILAVGETLLKPLLTFMSQAVESIIDHFVPQYQCMNGAAKLNTICKLAGDIVMPPAIMFAWLKGGVGALKLLEKSKGATISKFKNGFKDINLMNGKPNSSLTVTKPLDKIPEKDLVSVGRENKLTFSDPKIAEGMNGPFGEQYRNVLGKTDATSELAKSNLNLVDKVVQKLKKKGLSDTAIKKKLDEALNCKR
jgi:hypothetical protein